MRLRTYQGRNSLIRLRPTQHKTLKILNKKYPSDMEIERFRNEYDLLQGLDIAGVRKVLTYNQEDNQHLLTLEYIAGEKIDVFCYETHPDLAQKIRLFIQIASILAQVHQAGILHKDINPRHILVTPEQDIYLIDFSIASRFTLKQPHLGNPEKLEGTLHYISPEQTGRMNRSVDYRTDLYSLGVTFYELLTRRYPLSAKQPMALIYAHLAEKPTPPNHFDSKIPAVLSNIILKLLKKDPENRYQSAFGLVKDLEMCLGYMEQGQGIPDFKLGQFDFSGKLQIPEKLYGREKETETILHAFGRVLQGNVELTLVAGASGMGKSDLINETHRLLAQTQGYFVKGQFDEFQRNTPYYGWIKAFENLVDLLLTENDETLAQWKTKILKALDGQGAVLTEAVPNLETVIGKCEPVPLLNGENNQQRFNRIVQQFAKIITTKEHPFIIFLDNLQWADLASFQLLKDLVTDHENQYLLCIGAYRNTEISPTHPLFSTLQAIIQETPHVTEIGIGNLNQEAVLTMIAETLDLPKNDELRELGSIIFSKTQGNDLFTRQFLKNLYEEGLLHFSFDKKAWQWDNAKIEKAGFTDNVIEFMAQAVEKMPLETQKSLQLASCIGEKFNLKTLFEISDNQNIKKDLHRAIVEGLIFPTTTQGQYKFAHERVQQAAYALVPETEKQQNHLKIGQFLYDTLPPAKRQKRIFDIANHFNFGVKWVEKTSKKRQIIQMNKLASQQALDSSSYQLAIDYAEKGLSLVNKSGNMECTFDYFELTRNLMRGLHASGDFEAVENHANQVLKVPLSPIQQAEIYDLLILEYTISSRPEEAVELGKKALRSLGVPLPEENLEEVKKQLFDEVLWEINQVFTKELLNLPTCTDPQKIQIQELLNNLLVPTYVTQQGMLYSIITLSIIKNTIHYGLTGEATYGFASFGMLLCFEKGDYQKGHEFGQLSVDIGYKFNRLDHVARACYIWGNNIHSWIRSVRYTSEIFRKGFQAGEQSGELQFAGYIGIYQVLNPFYHHQSIAKTMEALPTKLEFAEETQNDIAIESLLAFPAAIHPLLAQPEWAQKWITETDYIAQVKGKNNYAYAHFLILKTIVHYVLEEYDTALDYAQEAEKIEDVLLGKFQTGVLNQYRSLIEIQLFDQTRRPEYFDKVTDNQKKMRLWATNCPENFLHKYLLIKAEEARVQYKPLGDVLHFYDQAISYAKQQNFWYDVAVAHEACAKYWLSIQKIPYANMHFLEAYQLYQKWGASTKLDKLEADYPTILQSAQSSNRKEQTNSEIRTQSGHSFDMETLLKATTSLSKQVRLKDLVHEMLQLLAHNSGANKITFLRKENTKWWVIADQENNQNHCSGAMLFETYPNLPKTVLSFVFRKAQPIRLDDMTQDERFGHDDYIQRTKSKSVLVIPIKHKNELLAVLYLENRLHTGVFHAQRYELVNALATQLAISMQNILFYEDLEDKVSQRTEELQEANRELQVTNEEMLQIQEEISAQRDLLALNNEELTAYQNRMSQSIRAAKLIQTALLPTKHRMITHFREHFILYLPKDVVSGDFYWLHNTPEHRILIELDCTGHGVPGAFMTLVGNAILNQIVQVGQEYSPSRIMRKLHLKLQEVLQQKHTDNQDGMDLSIVVLTEEEDYCNVTFGASGQKFYYTSLEDGKTSIEQIKASDKKIGGGYKKVSKNFEEHHLQLPYQTILYLSSDGFIDQNDFKRNRFGSHRFIKLLEEIHPLPLAKQKEILCQALKKHQDDTEQRDDITIVGVRI